VLHRRIKKTGLREEGEEKARYSQPCILANL